MDVSPVRSSAKCGSDFSIERILSDESGSSRGCGEPPSWLCCTRYQPPRIPRASNSACRARRSGRHARVPFTAAQAAALEAAYARAPYLAPPALRALAAALQLRDDRIKIWFQNRRARERREKSASIAPPRDVPLAPTSLFKSQGTSFTASIPWNHARTELNIVQNISPYQNSLQLGDVNEFPRDLSVAASSMSAYAPQTKEEYQRADTPLDIETIED